MNATGQAINYSAGRNIAIKVPDHEYRQTVHFYHNILGFPYAADCPQTSQNTALIFGQNILWIDCSDTLSQSEIWLEIRTNDAAAAKASLQEQGYTIRDALEPLPHDMNGFWLAGPSNIIHLLRS